MSNEDIAYEVTAMLQAAMVMCGPLLILTAILGLFIGMLQAVTQIQDQTLPQTIKLVAAVAFLAAFGAGLGVPVLERTEALFSTFHIMVR